MIERLISLIPAISDLSKSRRDLADNTLAAIANALSETSLYLAHLRYAGERDREHIEADGEDALAT